MVARKLAEYGVERIVLDPVMVAQSGDKLLQEDAVESLKEHLIPMATVLTPNVPEAEVLLDVIIATLDDMKQAAVRLLDLGCRSVLIKGGHLTGPASDILVQREGGEMTVLTDERVDTINTHGTGCTLSSAIAAQLARGEAVVDAVRNAKEYLTGAIRSGADYRIGHGHGPVHHFWRVWGSSGAAL